MNDLLSNAEIDALLDAFRSEGPNLDLPGERFMSAPAANDVGSDLFNPVDLLKPNRLSREQLRGLELYFESTAKLLSATISDRLRLDTQCDCVAVEQMRFQTWLDQLPGPVAIYVLKMEPFNQPVLFAASTSLLYGAVDRILGGSGRIKQLPKDFTAAEYTVADALVGPCLDRICESLAEVLAMKWSIENRFCNPSMAQILPSQDVVLSVYFQAAGDFLLGDLRLLIPFIALEPHLEDVGKGAVTGLSPGAMREQLAQTIRAVPVEMSVELGDARIPLRQLMTLAVGDVVPLGTRIGEPAVAPVQGRPKFLGQIGRRGNRLAFQVVDVLEQ